MHRFSSRSDESGGLSALRHARGHPFRVGPRKRTVGTLRRPGVPACGSRNTGGAYSTTDDFVAAVENLCMIPARPKRESEISRAGRGFPKELSTCHSPAFGFASEKQGKRRESSRSQHNRKKGRSYSLTSVSTLLPCWNSDAWPFSTSPRSRRERS